MNNCKQVYHETWMYGLPWASSEYVHNLKKFLKVVEDRWVHRGEYDSEDDIHDNLPPFSIGIPSMNVDINDAAYLRSDHNEGSYVEERFPFACTCLIITRTTKPSPSADDASASASSQRRLYLRSSVEDTDEVSYSALQLLPPPPFTLFTELTTSPITAASLGQELRIGSSTFSSGPTDSETIPISYVYNPFSAINNCLIGVWLLRYELDA
uniref:Uncharacterized protein n=2 Tax=Lactuca sativa TaxID=4236 RepID=A0A9R1X651_LACSA|nr:hypothetical protein LSAT_V11C600313510 [Lactuca sativa]KAJ0201327.1 hypothetical protein LSAT_V11C600318840 [Lactuca sativa]